LDASDGVWTLYRLHATIGFGCRTSSPSLRRCRWEEGVERATRRVGAGHTVAGDVIQALPEALAPLRD
jgi:hypothetical protein